MKRINRKAGTQTPLLEKGQQQTTINENEKD